MKDIWKDLQKASLWVVEMVDKMAERKADAWAKRMDDYWVWPMAADLEKKKVDTSAISTVPQRVV